jgi:hypothetical protein
MVFKTLLDGHFGDNAKRDCGPIYLQAVPIRHGYSAGMHAVQSVGIAMRPCVFSYLAGAEKPLWSPLGACCGEVCGEVSVPLFARNMWKLDSRSMKFTIRLQLSAQSIRILM